MWASWWFECSREKTSAKRLARMKFSERSARLRKMNEWNGLGGGRPKRSLSQAYKGRGKASMALASERSDEQAREQSEPIREAAAAGATTTTKTEQQQWKCSLAGVSWFQAKNFVRFSFRPASLRLQFAIKKIRQKISPCNSILASYQCLNIKHKVILSFGQDQGGKFPRP